MRTELFLSCFCPFEAPEKAQVCGTGHPRVRLGTNDSNYTPRAAGLPPPSLPWNLFSFWISVVHPTPPQPWQKPMPDNRNSPVDLATGARAPVLQTSPQINATKSPGGHLLHMPISILS